MNRSTSNAQITGPAAAAPSSAVSSGTPMKPVFGNAATSAPNAASFICTRGDSVTAIVKATMPSDASSDTRSTTGFNNCPIGVFMPKRNSSAGKAK